MKNGSCLRIVLVACLVIFFSVVPPAAALWSSNPSVNTPVATGGSSYTPQIAGDGRGGAIIVWQNYLNATARVYAQRIDSQGDPVWAPDGVEICTASGNQTNQQLVSDGAGGAVITWQDTRTAGTNHIYAQRIDRNGTVMWDQAGVAVCTAGASQYYPQIVSDYSGGAIITWSDMRSGSPDIYAQRIDANGNPAWTPDGVAVCIHSSLQQSPVITTDGAGGAIVAWSDNRDSYYSIYAQRLYDDGSLAWTSYPAGKKLSSYTSTNQMSPAIAYDGMTGALVAWRDGFDMTGWNVYAQRVDINGALLWSGGVAVSTAPGADMIPPKVTDDGNFGAIITWEYKPDANGLLNIYAQRISAAGAAQWTANGVRVNAADTISAYYAYPQIVSDGGGGAVITWHGNASDNDIYAQRISAAGAVQWTVNGAAVSTAAGSQSSPQMISNGSDGVIFAWQDGRTELKSEIYAQRVLFDGALPACSRITISPGTLPEGRYNTSYAQTITADGGTGPYTLGLIGYLPDGLIFSGATLSGTPTLAGIFPVSVTATDANQCLAGIDYNLTIKADTTTTITSHSPDPSSGGQTVAITYSVTSMAGTPTGDVTVSDGTASCTGSVAAGTCSLIMTTIGSKTLTAHYAGDASFGASTSAGVAHTVTASSIRIDGAIPEYYANIQDVYNASQNGHVIQIQGMEFTENLDFGRNVAVTVQGGYDTEFANITGMTSIAGRMTIGGGVITIAWIVIH